MVTLGVPKLCWSTGHTHQPDTTQLPGGASWPHMEPEFHYVSIVTVYTTGTEWCVCVQEAASFDPEPLHHSCLGQKEGIVTSFSWPQGHRLSLKLPEQGWVSTGNISGVQKRLLAPEQVAF